MACQHLHSHALKPGRWHRLWCAECRAARAADSTLALGIACMKAHPFPAEGVNRTLTAMGLPSSPTGFRVHWRRAFRRLYLPAGALTVLLAVMGYGWLCYIDIDPNIPVPMPAMPSPNAYDLFRAAGQALVDDKKVSSAQSKPPTKPDIRLTQSQSHVYSLAEKEALLQENVKALTLLRRGLAYSYQEPPVRSFNAFFPYYSTYRSLARLLALEAQVKAARGDWKGAANSGLDAMEMGAKIPKGAPLIGKLVGIACEAIGRKSVLEARDHLTAEESRSVARRLETITALHVSYADTLQEEKWLTLSSLQEAFRQPRWRSLFAFQLPVASTFEQGEPNSTDNGRTLNYIRLFTLSKRQILSNYTQYMDLAISDARLPGAIRPHTDSYYLPEDAVSRSVIPTFAQARLNDAVTEVQNAFLLTTLALRAYRLEHGQYPPYLAQLVPRYLKAVPLDSFTPPYSYRSQTLQYRRTGQTYKLYSFGPDGRDNGGVPIQDRNRPRDKGRYLIEWGSTGDIVAGINQH